MNQVDSSLFNCFYQNLDYGCDVNNKSSDTPVINDYFCVTVFHLQLHPGSYFLLCVSEDQLRAKDAHHADGCHVLQCHHSSYSCITA